jgi:hypothetical protein
MFVSETKESSSSSSWLVVVVVFIEIKDKRERGVDQRGRTN